MTVGAQQFRNALGRFATGVCVVTTRMAGQPIGVTVSSLTSVSLDPPLILICLGKDTGSLDAFTQGDFFVVNVLAQSQRGLSDRFAFRRSEGFDDVNFSLSEKGCPVLTDCVANLECRRVNVIEAGDHWIVVGQVDATRTSDAAPLLHYRGVYAGVAEPVAEQ